MLCDPGEGIFSVSYLHINLWTCSLFRRPKTRNGSSLKEQFKMAAMNRETNHQSKKQSKQKEQPNNLVKRDNENISFADEEIETDAVSSSLPQLLIREQSAVDSGQKPSSLPEEDFNLLSISSAQATNCTPQGYIFYPFPANSITKHARSDLHTGLVDCSKHPKHEEFTPIHELAMHNLPKPFRKSCWSELIQLKAIEVVRLSLSHTSKNRPEELGFKDWKTVRYGTGTVYITNMDKTEPCSCSAIDSAHSVSGVFRVLTAAHVVFDDEEAKSLTLDFFYDSADLSTVVKGWGVKVYHVDVKRRRSIIMCRTHDLSLFQRLKDAQNKRSELLKVIEPEVDAAQMVVLISHPHGLCKQVSFGTLKGKTIDGEIKVTNEGVSLVGCSLTYDTPTCSGSGGGPVNVLGGRTVSYAFAPHYATDGSNENISGLGWMRANID